MPQNYTYRYSHERTETHSAFCPICRKRIILSSEEKEQDFLFPKQLCCSPKHTQIYICNITDINEEIFDFTYQNGAFSDLKYKYILSGSYNFSFNERLQIKTPFQGRI
jgi:hypothetical protein